MIEIGDLVRFKKKYLRFFNKKQQISRVIRIAPNDYDWRTKTINIIIELDIEPYYVSNSWLVVHRKKKK